jgi:thymidylate synthase
MPQSLLGKQSFASVYIELLEELVVNGQQETNERTGHEVSSILGGVSFKLDLSDGLLPVPHNRKVHPKTAAAEVAWFLSGSRDLTWLQKHTKIWNNFVEPDGITIAAGYGYRWRHHFGRDQIDLALEALSNNPSDRRVMISAWDPQTDGLGAQGQRNVPCPTNFTLSTSNFDGTTDRELHSSLFLRSSDVFVGLPYDVMGHTLLMAAIANTLNMRLGTMHVTLAHAHLYDTHYDVAMRSLNQRNVRPACAVPTFDVIGIMARPDEYVAEMAELTKESKWPSFNPKIEVVI